MDGMQQITLFDNYSLQDLFKQIVMNSRQTRSQLKKTIEDIAQFLDDKVDLQILSPEIANYMNILVKNDQLLLKLANAATKIVTTRQKLQEQGTDLTEAQKQRIIEQAKKQMSSTLKRIKERSHEKKTA